jgi:hypothetical protein
MAEKAQSSEDQRGGSGLDDLTGAADSVARLLAAIETGELTAPAREVARLEGAYVALRAVEDALADRTPSHLTHREPSSGGSGSR